MDHARERSSKERAERKERDARARDVEARAGPTLMAPGFALDGISNRALLSLLRSGQLQRKARVSEASDPREHEADRAADAVVAGARPAQLAQLASGHARAAEVKRVPRADEQVAAAADLSLGGGRVASAPRPGDPDPTGADIVGRLPGGRSLDEKTRGLMESRFGESFGDVRIHTGHRPGEAADALAARAFTAGQDIVFAEGAFAPETIEGRRLLAHELAHVVQQRQGTGPIGSENETERDAQEAARQATSGGTPAVRERAARGSVQKEDLDPVESEAARHPTSVIAGIDPRFNPVGIANQLRHAIDQTEVQIWSLTRHINFPVVIAILSNLTADELKQVDELYAKHEQHRSLRQDILGGGESGFPSDLTPDQRKQVDALLAGAASPELAESYRRESEAAELHGLLHGKLEEAEIEQLMKLLRRDVSQNVEIMAAYRYLYHAELSADLGKLDVMNSVRAGMLLTGSVAAADALKVQMDQQRIKELDVQIKDLPVDLFGIAQKRREERERLVRDIEQRVEAAADEGRASAAGKDIETEEQIEAEKQAVRSHVAAVLGHQGATMGGTDAAVIAAIQSADPPAKVAAQLRRLMEADKLTPDALSMALRGLRDEAAREAWLRHPRGSEGEIAITERELADRWFIRLRDQWNAAVVGDGPTFDEILDRGEQTDVARNRALNLGAGGLDDVSELEFALSGDRKDMEAVKRVLADKSAAQIDELNAEYEKKTHRSLDQDLFGAAPTRAGEVNLQRFLPTGFAGLEGGPGKATGTDRLILEDYVQRPKHEGGIEEAEYIVRRADRWYAYTIENRGATGVWRDLWGDEARDILDETIKTVHDLRAQYLATIKTNPEEAGKILQQMRLAKATIRGDRAEYERATAELRGTFEMIGSFVLQAALTEVLGPIAGAIFKVGEAAEAVAVEAQIAEWAREASVGVASTMASNKIIYGSEYSWAMIKHDFVTGFAGAIGQAGAEKLADVIATPVAAGFARVVSGQGGAEFVKRTIRSGEASAIPSLAAKVASKVRDETVKAVGNIGSLTLTDDVDLQNVVKTIVMAKGSEALRKTIRQVASEPTAPLARPTDQPLRPGSGEEPSAKVTTGRTLVPEQPTVPTPGELASPEAPEPISLRLPEPEKVISAAGRPASGEEPSAKVTTGRTPLPESTLVEQPTVPTPGELASREAPEPISLRLPEPEKVISAAGRPASGEEPSAKVTTGRTPLPESTLVEQPTVPTPGELASREAPEPISLHLPEPEIVSAAGGGGIKRFAPRPGAPHDEFAAEPTQVTGPPAGAVAQPLDPHHPVQAWKLYRQHIAADPYREVALLYNHALDEWAVVQGDSESVDTVEAMRFLGWDIADTTVGRHSHPIGTSGQTSEPGLLPSGRGFDIDLVRSESYKGERVPGSQWHAIDVVTSQGPDRTWVFYSRETGIWTVDYPAQGERGGRGRVSFSSRHQYRLWFKSRFNFEPRERGDVSGTPVPLSPGGSAQRRTDIGGEDDVVSTIDPDDLVHLTYRDKSTTISLRDKQNNAKLVRDFGISKEQARQILQDIREPRLLPRTLIGFAQTKGDPRSYLISLLRNTDQEGYTVWRGDAFAKPVVEGIRYKARDPGEDMPETLRLSEYALVFEESKANQFQPKKSETVEGIQEWQYPGGGQRGGEALTKPIAVVRVNERGEIVEIVDHVELDTPTEGRAKLIKRFQELGWKMKL